eukprot:1342860-Amorphochlora_amoeboformis.AAC.1
MDSTLRGFSNTVASRRSRSRGSGHSRERSSSWPAGSLLLGAEADQEGEKEGSLYDVTEKPSDLLFKRRRGDNDLGWWQRDPEKGKKHNRRDSSLMREQLMRAFAEGALQSPMTTPKEEVRPGFPNLKVGLTNFHAGKGLEGPCVGAIETNRG